MSWIESHTTLRNHKKLIALCNTLQVNRAEAIGHLHMLWWWAIENREDGDLSGLFDRDIAVACDWGGDPEQMIKALHTSKWLQNYRLVDWGDYSWRLLGMRKSNRERQKKYRNTLHNTLVTGATIPNLTKHNTKDLSLWFESFYSKYPRKEAKKDALKAFVQLSPSDELLQLILMGVENQKKTDQWTKDCGKYIPLPASWLRGRRWEDEVKTVKGVYDGLPNQKF